MTDHRNPQGQPIGAPVTGWTGAPMLPHTPIDGIRCDLVPLVVGHAAALHRAFAADTSGTLWTYMPMGPFESEADYADWVAGAAEQTDPLFYTVIDKASGRPVGVCSYLRITPLHGAVEVGWITYAPALKQTATATEVMYLMMKRAFDLGYRRYEWKCDALNAPSRRAAQRLGFVYEGTFRQAVVVKGRNRDTAWFSITDQEWPAIEAAFVQWLSPDNFDDVGRQRMPLQSFRQP